MNFESKTIIIAECNFLQDSLWKMYVGKNEFTELRWREIAQRLQKIRDITREDWGK